MSRKAPTNNHGSGSSDGDPGSLDELQTSGRGAGEEPGAEVSSGNLALVDGRKAVHVFVATDPISHLQMGYKVFNSPLQCKSYTRNQTNDGL